MGICWYCHWGWPKPVYEIYQEALRRLNGDDHPLQYGLAHIVWADENFLSAKWCLDHFHEYISDLSPLESGVVRWSLEELEKLPFEVRDPCPDDYDHEHPENFPPPAGVEMVRDPEGRAWESCGN